MQLLSSQARGNMRGKREIKKEEKKRETSFISLSHWDGNCSRVSTVDTSTKTDYPEGLEKKDLNIKCLNMWPVFKKVQLPLRLVKAMKLLNTFKKSVCFFFVNYEYQSIFSITFIPCSIVRSGNIWRFSLVSHVNIGSNRRRIYNKVKYIAVLISRFSSVLQSDRILWISKYCGNHSLVVFCSNSCLHL